MNKTSFLIDGFNLYHSVVDAGRDLGGASIKWLDIRSLCASYLPLVGNRAEIEKVYYFTALAEHMVSRDPGKIERHKRLIDCLKSTGVTCVLGRFKQKTIHCNGCSQDIIHHEEKETDVAISVMLIEILMKDECDTAFLVTGDTDLAPAVRTAKRLFPDKRIGFIFPYRRKNMELDRIADASFVIKKEKYLQHQFPNPVVLPSGRTIQKPNRW